MTRFWFASAMMLVVLSMAPAHAQTTPQPAQEPATDKTFSYAGETYSEGASLCVTSRAAIACNNGQWSPDVKFDPSYCGDGGREGTRYGDNESNDKEGCEPGMRHHNRPGTSRQYNDESDW